MSSMARGRRRNAFTTLKTAVFAPIASPRERTTATVSPIFLRMTCRAQRMSCLKVPMMFLLFSMDRIAASGRAQDLSAPLLADATHQEETGEVAPRLLLGDAEPLELA